MKFEIGDAAFLNRDLSSLQEGDMVEVVGIMMADGVLGSVVDRYQCLHHKDGEVSVHYLKEEWLEVENELQPIIEVPEWIQKALDDFETSASYEEKEYFGREDEFETKEERLPLKVIDEAENFMLECMYDNALTIKQRLIDKALDERDEELFELVMSGQYDFNGDEFDYE